MFINNTDERLFNDFSNDLKSSAKALGLNPNVPIHVYTINQYKLLENVPDIRFSKYDTFAYVARMQDLGKPNNDYYAIVYSPENIAALSFLDADFYAAIAHEVGHIINYRNPTIPNEGWYAEIMADELACNLGLRSQLGAALLKLQQQDVLSESQRNEINLRIKYLNLSMEH